MLVINGKLKVFHVPMHVVAAIVADHGNPYDYIEPYFTTDYYRSSYAIPITPVPDIEQEVSEGLEDFITNPPLTRKRPSRPKIKRIKSKGEEPKANKCSRCGQTRKHNRRTCSNPISYLLSSWFPSCGHFGFLCIFYYVCFELCTHYNYV